MRQPLAPLTLDTYVRAALAPSSPRKKSRMGDLLPSPFLAPGRTTSTTSTTPGPLTTLYSSPQRRSGGGSRVLGASSPARRMEGEEEGEDEMGTSSPKRLLDLFKTAGGRTRAESPSLGAVSPGRTRRGSMAPPSPRHALSPFRSNKKVEERVEEPAGPTWSFYQDDEAAFPLPTSCVALPPAEEDAAMVATSEEEDTADLTPPDKENSRPPLRSRRSASLLSQSTSVLPQSTTSDVTVAPSPPPLATASLLTSTIPSPVRPPPLPNFPSASLSAPATLVTSPRTPPGSSSPQFSFYPDENVAPAEVGSAFGEAAATSFSPVLGSTPQGEPEEGTFGAVGAMPETGGKRQSLERAAGGEKRVKLA